MENNSQTKKCARCKIDKNIELFGKKSRNKDGLNIFCKKCINNYYHENKDRTKQYYLENKDKFKKYYTDNKENIRKTKKMWAEKNKEKMFLNVF